MISIVRHHTWWQKRHVRNILFGAPSGHTSRRPYDNLPQTILNLATISCIRCTIFCSRHTKRINVTQAETEDRYKKPTQAQLQIKLTETSRKTRCTADKENMAFGTVNAGTTDLLVLDYLWLVMKAGTREPLCKAHGLPGTWSRCKLYFRPLTAAPHVLEIDTKKRTNSALGPESVNFCKHFIIIK